ncbi:MAG: helix-turn-helix transcriptional regulator [Herminiimonas sp.]|uniref:helix-turn-helix domain-containing protein n=1 Tax=Herminiimonas sp. TaxID=1926289 RepID=UPI002727D68B|nr:helix-turn-helix transcriptional regulator [Herminiimonas sp.]MDO9421055.1 helix-turn-helix transcriptional regulator [Herminiimonas sp.]
MKYDNLMKKVLGNSSVNAKAKELDIPQKSLDRYMKGEHLPDCATAIILAKAAGVSIEEMVVAVAQKKAELRPEKMHSFLRPAIASLVTGFIAVNLFLTPTPAKAAPLLASQDASLYIM